MDALRARLTYANLMSSVAVFIALGGVSYAALKLPNNSVGTNQIKNRAVTKAKLDPRLVSSLAGKTGPQGLLGAQGLKGNMGAQGPEGAQGRAGADGQNGAAGPSDTYVAGIADSVLDTTGGYSEVVSITVPAGSYLLGASMWLAKQVSGTSQITCKLESSDTLPRTLWDQSSASLLTDASTGSSLSLAGADTFAAAQVVKVFCGAFDKATNAVNVRLWAIRTGNLHATLPLPND
jgi:Collagen triple helix repeat (20 copies)